MASPFLPELAGLPETKSVDTAAFRTNAYLRRLPPLPGASTEDLSWGPSAQSIATAEYANDMRAAYATSRAYDRRNRAVAKARARQNDRGLKNSESRGRVNRRKLQGTTNRRSKSYILRNARDYLGMGTDLYR